MKNYRKITLVMLMMSALAACAPKTTGSNPTANVTGTLPTTSNPVTPGTGTTPGTGSTAAGCDGVYRAGATQCYYKNIPTVMASGGAYGSTWWSSTQFIASTGNSPNQFATDATFNVRIVPRSPIANALSTFNRTCSPYMMFATKLKVQLMLHQAGVTVGEVATLTSPIDTPSNVWHFTVPVTTSPLVLEVVNVLSDSRCTGKYGSIPSSCTTNPYLDIPINGTTWPTECVGFDIQYSTDTTYDLPGASAN